MLPLAGVFLMVVFSLHYYPKIGLFLSQTIPNLPIAISNFLGFLVVMVLIGLFFKILRTLLDKVIKVEWHPFLERFGGLIAGAVRAYLTVSLVLMLIAMMPFSYLQRSIRDKSVFGMYFLKGGPIVYEKVSRFLPVIGQGAPRQDKEAITQDLVSDKSMPFPKSKTERAAGYAR
jgi:uncharacterized membrane protein required for colicin V production